jgi:hypothetical protein
MKPLPYFDWMQRRGMPPEADRVFRLIASARGAGITRQELGNAIQLSRAVLDDLLEALAELGQIVMSWENGWLVIRARQ